jgi:hypothetical protein
VRRLVRFLFGVAGRHAGVGEPLLGDLGIDPFANAAGRGDVGPLRISHGERSDEK